MAKNVVADWSSVADENTDVGGINIAEGSAARLWNNAKREMMSQLAVKFADNDTATALRTTAIDDALAALQDEVTLNTDRVAEIFYRHVPNLADAIARADSGDLAVGVYVVVEGHTTPGDSGGFTGIVEAAKNPLYPGGGQVKPLHTKALNPFMFGGIDVGADIDSQPIADITAAADSTDALKATVALALETGQDWLASLDGKGIKISDTIKFGNANSNNTIERISSDGGVVLMQSADPKVIFDCVGIDPFPPPRVENLHLRTPNPTSNDPANWSPARYGITFGRRTDNRTSGLARIGSNNTIQGHFFGAAVGIAGASESNSFEGSSLYYNYLGISVVMAGTDVLQNTFRAGGTFPGGWGTGHRVTNGTSTATIWSVTGGSIWAELDAGDAPWGVGDTVTNTSNGNTSATLTSVTGLVGPISDDGVGGTAPAYPTTTATTTWIMPGTRFLNNADSGLMPTALISDFSDIVSIATDFSRSESTGDHVWCMGNTGRLTFLQPYAHAGHAASFLFGNPDQTESTVSMLNIQDPLTAGALAPRQISIIGPTNFVAPKLSMNGVLDFRGGGRVTNETSEIHVRGPNAEIHFDQAAQVRGLIKMAPTTPHTISGTSINMRAILDFGNGLKRAGNRQSSIVAGGTVEVDSAYTLIGTTGGAAAVTTLRVADNVLTGGSSFYLSGISPSSPVTIQMNTGNIRGSSGDIILSSTANVIKIIQSATTGDFHVVQ